MALNRMTKKAFGGMIEVCKEALKQDNVTKSNVADILLCLSSWCGDHKLREVSGKASWWLKYAGPILQQFAESLRKEVEFDKRKGG